MARFLTVESCHPGSIVRCVDMARTNARAVRTALTREAWSAINRAWLHGEARDGRVYYQASSESEIVAGLIALLLKVYSGRKPQEIIDTPPDFLQKIGVWENITSNRINGLNGMIALIQAVAKAELKAA